MARGIPAITPGKRSPISISRMSRARRSTAKLRTKDEARRTLCGVFFSQLSIRARACNSARSRDPSMPLRLSAQTKDSGGEARTSLLRTRDITRVLRCHSSSLDEVRAVVGPPARSWRSRMSGPGRPNEDEVAQRRQRIRLFRAVSVATREHVARLRALRSAPAGLVYRHAWASKATSSVAGRHDVARYERTKGCTTRSSRGSDS